MQTHANKTKRSAYLKVHNTNISTYLLGVENSLHKNRFIGKSQYIAILLFAEIYLSNVPPQLNYYNALTLKISIYSFPDLFNDVLYILFRYIRYERKSTKHK